jgi:hypothetical protein
MCRILEHLIPDLAAAVNKDLGGYEVRVGCGRFGLHSTYKHCRLKMASCLFLGFLTGTIFCSFSFAMASWRACVELRELLSVSITRVRVTTAIFAPSYAETYCVLCMVSRDAHPPDGCRFPLCAESNRGIRCHGGFCGCLIPRARVRSILKKSLWGQRCLPLALIERGGNVTNVWYPLSSLPHSWLSGRQRLFDGKQIMSLEALLNPGGSYSWGQLSV